MAAWTAESVHCVLFSPPHLGGGDAYQPWLKLFGTSPASFQQSAPNMPRGSSQASGSVGDFHIAIITMPGRLELLIGPSDQNLNEAFPVIPNPSEALKLVQEYAGRLAGDSEVLRIGVIVNVVEHVRTAQDAVAQFASAVPVRDIPSRARDLSFSVNFRRPSALPDWEINRLARWSVSTKQLMQMSASGGGAITPGPTVEQEAFNLQVDVNTVLRQQPLPHDRIKHVLEELAQEADAILSSGYEHVTR
ncbi:hypothetical protein [Aurantimonas coralicida]|uniref:hypothetical protein n=1 Tax=Aurantimonas coralicida TaxID=182270 RepID=UPI001D18C125|nr:hypothetical protein [Aurantimonas coralicida]MCC4299355.1 hypothetical protein [Aurantimonas coralicida]